MAYNTRTSRSRGRGFENQVVKRLTAMGFKSKKILLSGSHLAKPYDVIVSPFRLKIEAKRTMKDHITFMAKWLDKVSDKLIIVFAVGKYSGGKPVEMWALSPDALVRTWPIIEMKKAKKVERETILKAPFTLMYNGRQFMVQTFEGYMKSGRFSEPKENTDGTGTEPIRT